MADRKVMQALSKADVQRLQSAQVITRLADAAKELVENAIDGGAKKVSVRLTNNGLDAVEVIDDGSGIDAEDFEHLVTNHATSKLRAFADLDALSSLGFRGEALSSLCTLGELSVTTCTKATAPRGTSLVYATDGRLVSRKVVPAQVGTQVKVANLFAGLPVRRKDFEKNAKRDLAHAVKAVEATAIAQPSVRFELVHITARGRTTVLNTTGSGALRKVIGEVVNPRLAPSLVDFSFSVESTGWVSATLQTIGRAATTSTIVFTGIMSPPTWNTGTATSDRQLCSINRRPCNLPQICRVFNEQFDAATGGGTRTPFLVINLIVPPGAFDVNVSPDKRTVFLHNEAEILPALRAQVAAFLETDSRQLDAASTALEPAPTAKMPFMSAERSLVNDLKDESSPPPLETTSLSSFSYGASTTLGVTGPAARQYSSAKRKRSPQRGTTQTKLAFAPASYATEGAGEVVPDTREELDLSAQQVASDVSEESEVSDVDDAREASQGPQVQDGELAQELDTGQDSSVSATWAADTAAQVDAVGPLDQADVSMADAADDDAPEDAIEAQAVDADEAAALKTVLEDVKPRPLQRFLNRLASIESSPTSQHVHSLQSQTTTTGLLDRIKGRPRSRPHTREGDMMTTSDSGVPRLDRAGIDSGTEQDEAESVLTLHLSKDDFFAMTVVGQFNLGFIVCRDRTGRHLFIVDQHASDEKYNYERLMRNAVIDAQPLAVPLKLELGALDRVNIRDHLPLLKKNGFYVAPVVPTQADRGDGETSQGDGDVDGAEEREEAYVLKSLPVSGKVSFDVNDLREILDAIVDSPWRSAEPSSDGFGRGDDRAQGRKAAAVEVRDDVVRCTRARRMFASRACRSSIMIGKVLTKDRMRALLWHMGTMDRPWHCPHGRPTCRHLLDLRTLSSWRA